MGYHLKTPISPGGERSTPFRPVGPKTHTPGLQVKDRGYRFYNLELGRWMSRDPIEDKGFGLVSMYRTSQTGKAMEGASRRRLSSGVITFLGQHSPRSTISTQPYLFVLNDPANAIDPFGLEDWTAATVRGRLTAFNTGSEDTDSTMPVEGVMIFVGRCTSSGMGSGSGATTDASGNYSRRVPACMCLIVHVESAPPWYFRSGVVHNEPTDQPDITLFANGSYVRSVQIMLDVGETRTVDFSVPVRQ